MSNTLLQPGHRVCDYKLVLPINESLQETIIRLRAELYDRYKIPVPEGRKPALTVAEFCAYEGMEQNLFERVQQLVARTPAFTINLENFSSHSSHTIFIRVANRSAFYELAKELKVVRSLTKSLAQDSGFIPEPYVEIAQKLKPFQFIRIWMDCEARKFTASFTASSILVLKRSFSATGFEEVQRFELASQASLVRQGVLFA